MGLIDNPLLNNPFMGNPLDYQDVPEIDPLDFTSKYNTQLTPEEENLFQQWAMERAQAQGRKHIDTYDYDLRGAWKDIISGNMTPDQRGHLGDKYKKPNHPTFSEYSQYHGTDGYHGGSWTKEGYVPSKTNLQFRSPEELISYFGLYEPKTKLRLPFLRSDNK